MNEKEIREAEVKELRLRKSVILYELRRLHEELRNRARVRALPKGTIVTDIAYKRVDFAPKDTIGEIATRNVTSNGGLSLIM